MNAKLGVKERNAIFFFFSDFGFSFFFSFFFTFIDERPSCFSFVVFFPPLFVRFLLNKMRTLVPILCRICWHLSVFSLYVFCMLNTHVMELQSKKKNSTAVRPVWCKRDLPHNILLASLAPKWFIGLQAENKFSRSFQPP